MADGIPVSVSLAGEAYMHLGLGPLHMGVGRCVLHDREQY